MKYRNKSILLSFLAFMTACGRDGSSSNSTEKRFEDGRMENELLAVDGSNIQGTYLAKFMTINPHVVGTIPGSAQFKREDDNLYAYLRLFAGSPSIAHFQNVHSGNRCPNLGDDLNGDGYIDYQEALKVVGPILIPLDWDIGSQLSANNSWPKAFPNGSYEYLKVTNFNRFWNDLKALDKNPNDNIVKLSAEDGLSLNGKVVLVQGIDQAITIPETVAGYGRWKNFQTLPIACGVFAATSEEPGVIYEETIPGPVGTVEEGQDRPAPEGEGEIAGSGTVITGPSNEAGSNDSESEEDENGSSTSPRPNPVPERENESEEDNDSGICWPWERDCR